MLHSASRLFVSVMLFVSDKHSFLQAGTQSSSAPNQVGAGTTSHEIPHTGADRIPVYPLPSGNEDIVDLQLGDRKYIYITEVNL